MVRTMDKEILEGLSYNEKRLLLAMDAAKGVSTPEALIENGSFSLEVEVMGSASWLSTKGLMQIEEDQSVFYILADQKIAETGLAERRAIEIINKAQTYVDEINNALQEKGDTMDAAQKEQLTKLRDEASGAIAAKDIEKLREIVGRLEDAASQAYAQQQQQQANQGQQSQQQEGQQGPDDVVDADFTDAK